MKIRSKILLPIYVFIGIGFTIIGTSIYFIVEQNSLVNGFNHLETRTILKSNEVYNFLSEIDEKISEFSQSQEILKNLQALSKYQLQKDTGEYRYALGSLKSDISYFHSIYPEIQNIILTDTFGIALYTMDENIPEGTFVEVLYGKGFLDRIQSGKFTSDIRLKNPHNIEESFIFTARSLKGKGKHIGAIIIELDTKKLDTLLLSPNGLGKTGRTYIVGRDGVIKTQVEGSEPIKFIQRIASPTFTRCFWNDAPRDEKSYTNFLGEEVIGRHKYLPDIDMCLITEISLEEVLDTSQRILGILVLACVFTFLSISFLILKSIRSITSPLLYLREKMQEVREGKKDISLSIDSEDEIGDLAKTFGEMIHELNITDQQIQKKVISQTKEIRRKQKDLLKFEEALGKASDYIAIFDHKCRIVYINKSLEKETGFTLLECMGQHAYQFWRRDEGEEKMAKVWRKIQKTKKSVTIEMTTSRKNKTNFVSDAHISPILNDIGEIVFYLSIENDITKEKQVKKMKDEFISLVSHELRTPMTVIGGFSKLFLEEKFGSINSEQRKYLERIDSNIKYLIHMVNDMLDIEKLNSGKIEFHYESFDIYTLLDNLTQELLFMCEKKKIHLSLVGKHQKIISDEEKIKEVVINLVRNSYKFTKEGGFIYIKLSQSKGEVKIEVKDTGIGIEKQNFGKIFEKFGQVSSQLQKVHKGTGLGLSICKLIVEKLGGQIGFTSEYKKGSNFFFTIPTKPKRR